MRPSHSLMLLLGWVDKHKFKLRFLLSPVVLGLESRGFYNSPTCRCKGILLCLCTAWAHHAFIYLLCAFSHFGSPVWNVVQYFPLSYRKPSWKFFKGSLAKKPCFIYLHMLVSDLEMPAVWIWSIQISLNSFSLKGSLKSASSSVTLGFIPLLKPREGWCDANGTQKCPCTGNCTKCMGQRGNGTMAMPSEWIHIPTGDIGARLLIRLMLNHGEWRSDSFSGVSQWKYWF